MSAAKTYGPFIDEYGIPRQREAHALPMLHICPICKRDPHHPECPKARGNDGD